MSEQPENTKKEPLPPPESPEMREIREVEELLGEASGLGYSLAIHRTDPPWCAGYLDTWPLNGPISLGELRDAYGGRRFRLKILGPKGKYIRDLVCHIDDIPRRRGLPVQPAGIEFEKNPAPAAPPAPPPAPTPTAEPRMMELFERLVMRMLEPPAPVQLPAPVAAPAPLGSFDPLHQVQQVAETVKAIRAIASEFGGEDKTSDMIGNVLKLLDRAKPEGPARRRVPLPGQQQQQPAAQQHQAPRQAPPPPPAVNPSAPPPEQHQAPPAPPEQQAQDSDPADVLAQYSPEDAGAAIADYLAGLSEEEQRTAIAAAVGGEAVLDRLAGMVASSDHDESSTHDPGHSPPGDA